MWCGKFYCTAANLRQLGGKFNQSISRAKLTYIIFQQPKPNCSTERFIKAMQCGFDQNKYEIIQTQQSNVIFDIIKSWKFRKVLEGISRITFE